MEPSGNFGMPALIGGLLALIVVVLIVARIVRPPRRRAPPPPAAALPPHTDAAFLDSSHIIGSEGRETAAGREADASRRPGTDSKP
jgi:hypothetical protein